LTLDENIAGDTVTRGVGGSVYFISYVLNFLMESFLIYTAVGVDFDLNRLKEDFIRYFIIRRYGGLNIKFRNIYGAGVRRQFVENYGYKFDLGDLLDIFCRADIDILALVPVLGELSPIDVLTLSRYFSVGLDPQGFVRLVENNRVIYQRIDPMYFRWCKFIKFSLDEVSSLFSGVDEIIQYSLLIDGFMVLTLGSYGSILVRDGSFVYIPTLPVRGVVDTTGAGDVYMAGLLHSWVSGLDPLVGCVFSSSLANAYLREGFEGLSKYVYFSDLIWDGVEELSVSRVAELIDQYF